LELLNPAKLAIARQSKVKQSQARPSKAKQSQAKPSKVKQSQAKPSKAKPSKAKQSLASIQFKFQSMVEHNRISACFHNTFHLSLLDAALALRQFHRILLCLLRHRLGF
jgi:hypothetical protein